MGIAERKLRQHGETTEAILKAAWDIVISDGWQSLSMRKIAAAIEYSAPVIYDHFANKEAILKAFALEGFHKLNEDLKQAARDEAPAKQIDAIGKAYWQFSLENKEYYQIMYGLGMPSCEDVENTNELKEFSNIVSAPIKRLIDESGGDASLAMTKFKTFWSLLHGLVSIHILNHFQKAKANEHVLDDFTELFIAGIQTSKQSN